jgi:serine/threonine-protein kinase
LVDFGLSSSDTEFDGLYTPVGQEIGNRFLRVPEFRPDSANKDDPRTDLTFAVGVLFFLLTRTNPRVLQDEQGQFPHQRLPAATVLQGVIVAQPERLMRIFDQGFQHDLDRRFQSAEMLREALLACLEPQSSAAKADDIQRKILEHARSPAIVQGNAMMDKLYNIRGQIENLCDQMLAELQGVVSKLGGPVIDNDMREAVYSFETGFMYSRNSRVHIMLGFRLRHLGTEILVSVYSNMQQELEIRVPVSTAELTANDLEKIREAYLSKLAAVPGAM